MAIVSCGCVNSYSMGLKNISLFVIFAVVLLSYLSTFEVAKGEPEARRIVEIKKELKILNRHPVKTIHSESGDVFECINIYEQLAFDHPLLKDHKIQMKPNLPSKSFANHQNLRTTYNKPSVSFEIPNEECPKGTIPKLRMGSDDLSIHKSILNESTTTHFGESKFHRDDEYVAGLVYYVSGETYYGAKGVINMYNPQVSEDQFSSGEIAVENGPDGQANGIRVGVTVNPKLYGDHRTRLFALWTVDDYQKTGCYNALCPGFVQVDKAIALGAAVAKTSDCNGEKYDIPFLVYQDPETRNWWLAVQDNNVFVGYWPNNIFTSLSGGSTRIYWGGHVKGDANFETPEMGSGHYPTGTCPAYFNELQYVNGSNVLLNPRESKIEKIVQCSHYKVEYYGFQKGRGHTFEWGGPSGNCK